MSPVIDIEQLHVAMGHAWPGTAQDRVGEWLLRFGDGYTQRANSCLPVGDPGLPATEAVAAVEAAYAARGLAPRFQVPCHVRNDGATRPVRDDVDALLAQRGYAESDAVFVLVSTDDDTTEPDLPTGFRLAWDDAPSEGWVALASRRFHDSPAALAVTTAHPARYATWWQGAEPVARGRVARADDWFDVSDLLVVEQLRGRGLGRAMMAALSAEGRRLGARHGVLQVESGNVPALVLCTSTGWDAAGGYRYRVLEG